MMELAVGWALALWLVLAVVGTQPGQSLNICNEASSSSTSVSISNRRNATGHWIVKVDLSQSEAALSESKFPWHVDVEQHAISCDGKPTLRLLLTFTAPPAKPSPGYELYPGIGYYKFHSDLKTWTQAREVCEKEGAHLVIINSEQEAEVMSFLYKRSAIAHTMRWIWVGAHEQGERGYFTIFGDNLNSTGFSRWVPSQPDDKAADDCIVYNCPSKGVEDTPCTGGFIYVCEQELW